MGEAGRHGGEIAFLLPSLRVLHKAGLAMTISGLKHYGLVTLKREKSGEIRPQVTFTHLRVDLPLSSEQRIRH